MSGTNAGTGQPMCFRCAKCRVARPRYRGRGAPPTGYADRVKLTGKTREFARAGVRMSKTARQYKCDDCGHVGWSRHNELARIEASS